jgi:hypothetical protein
MSVAESNKPISARLRWLRPEQGGRPSPTPGPTYSTVARFNDFHTPPDQTGTHLVSIRFLSDIGPVDRLAPDRVFVLYEGHRKVAEGVVLANSGT